MKNVKKILALLVAIMMILASLSAFATSDDPEPATEPAAATKGSITVQPSGTVTLENKTLKAYKILNATYSEGTGTDQKIAYTIPADLADFYDAEFGNGTETATELAAAAGKTVDQYVVEQIAALDDAGIKDFVTHALAAAKDAGITAIEGAADGNNVKFADLDAGYYVIEDEGTATPISSLMLDTVTNADVEITLKAEDKTQKEIMTAGDLVNSKANELGLGRAVNYKITQEIPDTTGYDYYYYMINDTLSAGLTFNPETVVVTVGGDELDEGVDYYLYYDGDDYGTDDSILDGKTFIVAFNDVVADIAADTYAAGDAVEIIYSATVNSDAVVGVDPNNNKANVEYSNNPDKDGKGDWDEDHPGIPANDGNHPTGEGPDKYTVTYTTQVTIYKVDGKTQEKLEGVEFTLTGTAVDAVFKAEEVYEIDPNGDYYLLNDGTYTTTDPQTEPTVEETTGGAGWVEDADYEEADGRVVGGKIYRPYVEATDSDETRYIIIEPNDADYASTTTKYSKVVVPSDDSEEYDIARSGLTDADGKLVFSQLAAGDYTLAETGVLPGYNDIPDITFTLVCKTPSVDEIIAGNEEATWSFTKVENGTVAFDQENGTFKITIENNSGVELPSTGGIGTTIFYVGGSLLALAAAILLVTKRRMNNND